MPKAVPVDVKRGFLFYLPQFFSGCKTSTNHVTSIFTMKQYVIDGLRLEDYEKIKKYCDENLGSPSLDSIYWVEMDRNILNEVQLAHVSCQPHYFAIDLEEQHLSCEFLVRIKKNIKCDCMAYADRKQREWIMDKVDAMLEELNITV